MEHTLQLPIPKIQARALDPTLEKQLLDQGLHPILARILAARLKAEDVNWQQMLEPKLNYLLSPARMQDIDKASKRVAQAIIKGEIIGVETDHDCDGQTSHAVLFHNLLKNFKHPERLIRSYIGHRLNEGYGLSLHVANRILVDDPRPSLIITADNGSADEPRIAMLKEQNIDVIVTDHHQLPLSGPPKSAYACLNPTRADCNYGDPYIAGCMVAWLLMAATRTELIAQGYLPVDAPRLSDSLDFVAVGTIADCVSMARSINNRAVVNYGLKLINSGSRPCWRALKSLVKNEITAEDLGFKLGPLLNSDGRLACAFGSVSFLLSKNEHEAEEWIAHLQEQNRERKLIQNKITQQGLKIAAEQVAKGNYGLCIYLPDGHSGVHGICASRIKDNFGRPTVFLAPKQAEDNIITGSIRGIENFDVGRAIAWIIQQNPRLLIAGGGHKGAGGVSFYKEKLELFAIQFEQAVRQQLQAQDLGPVILTDGELMKQWINLDTLSTLKTLEPYGREFENPTFELKALLLNFRVIGDGTHARVELEVDKQRFSGVWFNFRQHDGLPIPVQIGELVQCVVSLQANDFGGIKRCELQVAFMCPSE